MLRGERIVLRAMEREDMRRLHELYGSVALVLLADGVWRPVSLAAYERDFDKWIEDRERADFVIEADGRVVGECGLHPRSDRVAGVAELGISILDPDYVGKGYGREAIGLLLDWAFRVMNYRRIWLRTDAPNVRAIRCYAACGFVEEGRLRQHNYSDGTYCDVVAMGLLREEWAARNRG